MVLNVQEAVALGLQPFLLAQAQRFPPAQLDLLLRGSEVRSDQQRMDTSAGESQGLQGLRSGGGAGSGGLVFVCCGTL